MTMYEFIEASIYIGLAWMVFWCVVFFMFIVLRDRKYFSKIIKNKFKEWFNGFTR